MLGYLFPLCRRTPLKHRLEESMKRRQSEGLCGKPRDVNKPDMFVQLVFHVEKGSKVFVPIPETGDPYIFLD